MRFDLSMFVLRRGMIWLGVATLLLSVSWPALSADASRVEPANLPPVLQALVKAGKAEVLKQFPTAVPDLTGYVIKHDGQSEVIYGSHGNLFIGQLISAKGENLTNSYGQRYLPKPDFGAAVKKLDQHGHLIAEGAKKAPLLYAFVDPDCIFCYHFFKATRAPVKAGKLRVKWVMLGFLKSSSAGRAVAILTAKDPLAALHENYTKFDAGHEEGAVPPDKHPTAKMQALLTTHFDTMRALGSRGTPTLLYLDSHKKWAMRVGFPPPTWLTAYEEGKPVPN